MRCITCVHFIIFNIAELIILRYTTVQGRLPRRPGARHSRRHLGLGVVIDCELSLAAHLDYGRRDRPSAPSDNL